MVVLLVLVAGLYIVKRVVAFGVVALVWWSAMVPRIEVVLVGISMMLVAKLGFLVPLVAY